MPVHTHRPPSTRGEAPLSILLGAGFALALFVVMALSQMMGRVEPPKNELIETMMAYVPPEIQEFEEEPPPPPAEKEEAPPPELENETPQLSLDQLDIALNPGTGGSLTGDFAMPTISTSSSALGTDDFVDFSELDQMPRPLGQPGFNFPRRLKKKKVSGTIVLLIALAESGEVLDVEIESSELPKFNAFVLGEVEEWRFTPPTKDGRSVKTKARIPIPIKIR